MNKSLQQTSPEPEGDGDDAIIGSAAKWSALIILCLAAAATGLWYVLRPQTNQQKAEDTETNLPHVARTNTIKIPRIPFVDITKSAGIDFVHENGARGEKLLPETMAGGGGFLDYDGDGDADIFLVNSQQWEHHRQPGQPQATCALYENDGKGNFRNVSARTKTNLSLYGMGFAAGDFDNDGDCDLYLTAVGSNVLLRNDQGTFVDVTRKMQVAGADNAYSSSAGWFDYDNDGDLDLFVCNYVVWSREFDLAQNFQLTGGGRAYGRPQDFAGVFPVLFRNDGDKFVDVSESVGIQVRNPATGVPMAKSLGVTFRDFNSDGRLDIVVANDTVQNFLFENQGDRFIEKGVLSGIAFDADGQVRGAMGLDTMHMRGDQAVALAIGNFANEMTAFYVSPAGQILFRDEAIACGLGPRTRLALTFGVCFLDVDNDGRADLLAANGHLEEDINRVQARQHYEQPPQLFWNAGPHGPPEFVALTARELGEDFIRPMVGRGAAYADIDGDGDLDILLTATGQPCRLLRNDQATGHHWIRLTLTGEKSNRDAIGALVTIESGGETQTRQVMPTCSYLSQVEKTLTIGLGRRKTVDRVTVRWPSGQTTQHRNLAVDQRHHLKESTVATQ